MELSLKIGLIFYTKSIKQALDGEVPLIILTDDQWKILELLQPKQLKQE